MGCSRAYLWSSGYKISAAHLWVVLFMVEAAISMEQTLTILFPRSPGWGEWSFECDRVGHRIGLRTATCMIARHSLAGCGWWPALAGCGNIASFIY
jgi:hypothetical protein